MPFPDPFPNSIYNQVRQLTGGLFLEWGAVPDEKEEALADTIRANYAVSKLNEHHDAPFFLGMGFYAPHFPNYCPQKYFDLDDLPPGIRRKKLIEPGFTMPVWRR